jgi:quercetin dioxygenase-like cupin family protein
MGEPVTGERATSLEHPWDNPAGRATAELTARVAARVIGEHRHPALVEQFTVLEGELTMKRGSGWRSRPASGSCT